MDLKCVRRLYFSSRFGGGGLGGYTQQTFSSAHFLLRRHVLLFFGCLAKGVVNGGVDKQK